MEKHLDIRGDAKNGFSAHYNEEHTKQDASLKPCPFCGSDDLEIQNTHTPSYSVQCQGCQAEANGPYYYGKAMRTRKNCVRQHRKAFDSAVQAWNQRA